MKQLIKKTSLSNMRPVFSQGMSENVKRYIQLRKMFEENGLHNIFTEPVLTDGGGSITWYTELEGQVVDFTTLSQGEQEYVKGRLKEQVRKVYRAALKMLKAQDENPEIKEVLSLLDTCFEIPDYKDIFVVDKNGQKNFCIIRWGFNYDDFNASSGLINKLVGLRLSDMKIVSQYSNGKIAPDQPIFIEYDGQTKEIKTNSAGEFVISDIPYFKKIKIFQRDKTGQTVNIQEFASNYQEEYVYNVGIPKQDMNFKFVDNLGNPIRNVPVSFEYEGKKISKITDSNGNVILEGIPLGTEVKCEQNGNLQQVTCKENTSEYKIIGQQPKVPMNFKFVDQQNKPLANTPVRFEYNGQTVNATTDSSGNVILKDIPLYTNVRATQLADGNPVSSQNFTCEENKSEYLFTGKNPSQNIVLTARDNNGNLIPNQPYQIEYDGKNVQLTTDSNGNIPLSDVPVGAEVKVSQIINGNPTNPQTFTTQQGVTNYSITGTLPAVTPPAATNTSITLTTTDKNNNILANSKVILKIGSNPPVESFTDSQGKTTLNNIPLNTAFRVLAENGKLKADETLTISQQNEAKTIILKKNNCLWWILGGLLLLLLLLLLYFLLRHLGVFDNRKTIIDTVHVVDTTHKVVIDTVKKTKGMTITLVDQTSRTPVANAKIKIKYAGKEVTLKTDANGKVALEDAEKGMEIHTTINAPSYPECIVIFPYANEKTIYISKDGSEEVNEVILDCGTESLSGGKGTTIKVYDLKQEKGTFKLEYQMFNLPDKITVYEGDVSDIANNKILYETPTPVSNYNSAKIKFEKRFVTVKIVGKQSQTEWKYQVNCPE